jgi:tetratricopeptide (TPR) repeat protein
MLNLLEITVMRRRRLAFVGGLAGALALVGTLPAQTRTITQDPNAERLLIVTFRPGGKPGTAFAEALRERIPKDVPRKQVWPIPTEEVKINQEPSGFPYEIPLTTKDAAILSNRLRAEEFIEGSSVLENGQWKVDARLILANDAKLVQPLGSSTGRREDHAATPISKAFVEARKSLPPVRRCFASVNRRDYPAAIAAAREALTIYAQSTLARICLASAFAHMGQPADSVMPVVDQILAIDPKSYYALTLAWDAHKKAGTLEKGLPYITQVLLLDPNNVELYESVINDLVQNKLEEIAIDFVNSAIEKNPGDPQLLGLRFRLLVGTNNPKRTIAAGEELILTDTSATDTLFFQNLAAAYKADSQPKKAAEAIARGIKKFPTNARLARAYSQFLRDAGDTLASIAAARQAIALAPDDPGTTLAYLTIAQTFLTMGSLDSVGPVLRSAAGSARTATDSGNVALFVGSLANRILTAARTDSAAERATAVREQMEVAIGWFALADSLAPSATTKFQLGYAATLAMQQLAMKEIPARQATLSQEAVCELGRLGQTYAVMAQAKVVAGASSNTTGAATLMPVILGLSPHLESVVGKTCK